MKPFDLEHWSASRFQSFEQCPAEFYSRYVAGHPEQPSEAMLFGAAVHLGLEALFNGADGEYAFRTAWKVAIQEQLAGDTDQKLTAVGLALLDCVAELGLAGSPEWPFRLDTTLVWGAPTVGYVDLVSPDGKEVFDFKTTTGAWSQARADREVWQPVLYTWAVAERYGEWPKRFTYVVLNKIARRVDLFVVEHPEERWGTAYDQARAIARRVTDGDFACHGKHGACPECGAVWAHGHVCDLGSAPPRIRLEIRNG